MKKLMSVILVVLLFTLTACSESQSGGDSSSPVSQGGELSFARVISKMRNRAIPTIRRKHLRLLKQL